MVLVLLFSAALCLLFYKLKPKDDIKEKSNIPYGRSIGNAQIKGIKEFQNDYFSVEYSKKYILAVISDGLTDKFEGRYAAELSVNMLKENFKNIKNYMDIKEYFKNSFEDINNVLNKVWGNKIGTVVLAVIVGKNFIEWVSVGNCALYLYRNGEIFRIDDSKGTSVNFGKTRFRRKDKILLCTDGVYKSLKEKEITNSMREKIPTYDKAMKMSGLIKSKSLKYQDNATLVIVE